MTASPPPIPNLDQTRVRALLFDIDGTLSDTDDQMVDRLYQLLKHINFVFPAEKAHAFSRAVIRFLEAPGNWFLEFLDRLGLDGLLASYLDWQAQRPRSSELSPADFPLVPGVVPMLEIVHKRYPLAVVSARNEATTRLFLQHNNLEGFFDVVVTSQTTKLTKPFPDPLIHAAKALNIPIGNCLMIGDTATDVRAALAAGAQSLSVLCGFGVEKRLRLAGTHAILHSTSEVATYLTSSPAAL